MGEHFSNEGGAGYFFFVIDPVVPRSPTRGDAAEFGPGDFFGEAAILQDSEADATVTTTAPTKLLAMFGPTSPR